MRYFVSRSVWWTKMSDLKVSTPSILGLLCLL
uniref:Uncharacterized protein n=1 Tax=Arundo donax TaxID=35708 RepID=A0A0A8XQG9_ARUDO